MIKRMPALCLMLLLMAAFSACAANKQIDQKSLLQQELAKWENFSSEGIIEASHQGLSLRKIFVLNKTADSARLDVVDGGAFGINPNPLVSVYLGEYISLQSPLFPQLEAWGSLLDNPGFSLGVLGNPDSLISKYGETIISKHYLEVEGTRLQFSEQQRLEQVTHSGSDVKIDISYDRQGALDKVSIRIDADTVVELLFDSTEYGAAEVVPLPRKESLPGIDEAMEFLENALSLESEEQQ